MVGQTTILAVEFTQSLEGRIDLGQGVVGAVTSAIRMPLRDGASPSGLQRIGVCAGGQAQSVKIGEELGQGIHGVMVKKCDGIRKIIILKRIITW